MNTEEIIQAALAYRDVSKAAELPPTDALVRYSREGRAAAYAASTKARADVATARDRLFAAVDRYRASEPFWLTQDEFENATLDVSFGGGHSIQFGLIANMLDVSRHHDTYTIRIGSPVQIGPGGTLRLCVRGGLHEQRPAYPDAAGTLCIRIRISAAESEQ